MAMNRVFLDTNIVIDIIDQRARLPKIDKILQDLNEKGEFVLFVSTNSVADIYYILRKITPKIIIDDKLRNITILNSTAKGCDFAIASTDKHDDVEDIMQIACCNENKIDMFITADPKLVQTYKSLFHSKIQIELIQ
jgi:predicted nucleic acid-binding protein